MRAYIAEYQQQLNIFIIGESMVGKSTAISMITHGKPHKEAIMSTFIGRNDMVIKKYYTPGQCHKLYMWNDDLLDLYLHSYAQYYQLMGIIICMYDITNPESFLKVSKYIDTAMQSKTAKAIVILIGSKCDKKEDRKVSFSEGYSLAKSYSIKFAEISSISMAGLKEIVYILCCEASDTKQ